MLSHDRWRLATWTNCQIRLKLGAAQGFCPPAGGLLSVSSHAVAHRSCVPAAQSTFIASAASRSIMALTAAWAAAPLAPSMAISRLLCASNDAAR